MTYVSLPGQGLVWNMPRCYLSLHVSVEVTREARQTGKEGAQERGGSNGRDWTDDPAPAAYTSVGRDWCQRRILNGRLTRLSTGNMEEVTYLGSQVLQCCWPAKLAG